MTNSPDRNGVSGAIETPNFAGDDLTELVRARSEAINLVQWPARVAYSYVTSGAPERRTDLEFRAANAAFVTRRFADGVALEMRLPDLHLQFLHNGKAMPHVFDPQERSPAEAEAWILVELLHRGIDREKFSKKLPYTIPGLLTGDAEDYAPQACRKGLIQLTDWFVKAAAVLEAGARRPRQGRGHLSAADARSRARPAFRRLIYPAWIFTGRYREPRTVFLYRWWGEPCVTKAAARHREWEQTTCARRCCPRGSDALENGHGLIGDNPESLQACSSRFPRPVGASVAI